MGIDASAAAAVPPSSRAPTPAGWARATGEAEEDGAGVLVGAVIACAAAAAPLSSRAPAPAGSACAAEEAEEDGAGVLVGGGVDASAAASAAAAALGDGVAVGLEGRAGVWVAEGVRVGVGLMDEARAWAAPLLVECVALLGTGVGAAGSAPA